MTEWLAFRICISGRLFYIKFVILLLLLIGIMFIRRESRFKCSSIGNVIVSRANNSEGKWILNNFELEPIRRTSLFVRLWQINDPATAFVFLSNHIFCPLIKYTRCQICLSEPQIGPRQTDMQPSSFLLYPSKCLL